MLLVKVRLYVLLGSTTGQMVGWTEVKPVKDCVSVHCRQVGGPRLGWHISQRQLSRPVSKVCEQLSWQAHAAARWDFQYVYQSPQWYSPARAITDSALSLSHRMPEPFSRSVSVPHKDSVGPEPQS